MILYYAKIDFIKAGFSLLLSPTSFISNHQRAPVSGCVAKDCASFTQIINNNSRDLVGVITKIGTNNHPWMPFKCTKFWIEV